MSTTKQQKKPEEVKKETVASIAPVSYKDIEYPLEELRKHSRKVFGVKPEVFDGAFFSTKKHTSTKREAEKLIRSYLKKEVK